MAQNKTTYIRFFAGIDMQAITKLTQLVVEELRNGVDRFVLLMSSPGGGVFAGPTGYSHLKGIPAEVVTHKCGSVDSIAAVLSVQAHTACVCHTHDFLFMGSATTSQSLPGSERRPLTSASGV